MAQSPVFRKKKFLFCSWAPESANLFKTMRASIYTGPGRMRISARAPLSSTSGDRLRASFVIGRTGQVFKSPQSAKETQEIARAARRTIAPIRIFVAGRASAQPPPSPSWNRRAGLEPCEMRHGLEAAFSPVCQRVMFSELLRLHHRPKKQSVCPSDWNQVFPPRQPLAAGENQSLDSGHSNA